SPIFLDSADEPVQECDVIRRRRLSHGGCIDRGPCLASLGVRSTLRESIENSFAFGRAGETELVVAPVSAVAVQKNDQRPPRPGSGSRRAVNTARAIGGRITSFFDRRDRCESREDRR